MHSGNYYLQHRIMKDTFPRFASLLLVLTVFHSHGSSSQDHGDDGHRNAANAHMHRSSVAQLAERFDSPERDAYQKPSKVLPYLGELGGKTIMDIGAGSGYFTVRLAKAGAQVIAADVNEEFQDHLRARLETENLGNVELRKIPYDDPGLSEGEVDMVLLVNTYHHIDDRGSYFSKVREGIKANGELVVIDFFKTDIPVGPPENHKVSMDTVISELKMAGFVDFEVDVNLLPYQFIIRAR